MVTNVHFKQLFSVSLQNSAIVCPYDVFLPAALVRFYFVAPKTFISE